MVERIGHIAFYVSDMDRSVDFYTRVLGFTEAFRMIRDDGALAGVYLYIAEGQFVELFQAAAPAVHGTAGTVGYAVNCPGYAHYCVQVADLEAALKKISAEGAPIDVEIRTGMSKCRMFWTHDPDGNKIEIMELPPESMQAQAIARLTGN